MNIQRGDVTEPSEDEMLDVWKVGESSQMRVCVYIKS